MFRVTSNKMETSVEFKTVEEAKQAAFDIAYPYARYIGSIVSQIWEEETNSLVLEMVLEFPCRKYLQIEDISFTKYTAGIKYPIFVTVAINLI